MRERVRAETPDDPLPLKISKKKKLAAGIPAVTSSLKHGLKNMGIPRTLRTLTMVNQQSGFDCPGCAWPDPSHRTQFEFCENGAKAVADEATTRRVTPQFFSKYTVQELSQKSDMWLNKQGRITNPMHLKPGASNYSEISWDDAFELLRAIFKQWIILIGRSSGQAAQVTAAFLYQAMVRSKYKQPTIVRTCVMNRAAKALASLLASGKELCILKISIVRSHTRYWTTRARTTQEC